MSFKDFVAFVLRMVGFWLVINTLVGVSSASFFIIEATSGESYRGQWSLLVISMVVPIAIGAVLAFIPYKITNFFILESVGINATPEFCNLLTRVGVGLLGIYIIATGLQYLASGVVTYYYFSPEYPEHADGMGANIVSQGLRVFIGFCLVLGSKVIAMKLAGFWFKAKSI